MPVIKIPRPIVNQILTLAQDTSNEVCGLISINTDQKMKLYALENTANNPEQFFSMEPAATINAMKSMREQQASLFAIFHSHPRSPAFPSKTDIEQHGYPEALYLIVSLNTKGVLELKAFKIEADQVHSVDLAI